MRAPGHLPRPHVVPVLVREVLGLRPWESARTFGGRGAGGRMGARRREGRGGLFAGGTPRMPPITALATWSRCSHRTCGAAQVSRSRPEACRNRGVANGRRR